MNQVCSVASHLSLFVYDVLNTPTEKPLITTKAESECPTENPQRLHVSSCSPSLVFDDLGVLLLRTSHPLDSHRISSLSFARNFIYMHPNHSL